MLSGGREEGRYSFMLALSLFSAVLSHSGAHGGNWLLWKQAAPSTSLRALGVVSLVAGIMNGTTARVAAPFSLM
jgi:hypothetical protein